MQWNILKLCYTSGAKLQQDLFGVLLWFRDLPVAMVCDIAEIYLQIKLYPSDRLCHRILWRNLDSGKKLTVYEFEISVWFKPLTFWLN